jgi:hypothetical protein
MRELNVSVISPDLEGWGGGRGGPLAPDCPPVGRDVFSKKDLKRNLKVKESLTVYTDLPSPCFLLCSMLEVET